MSSKCTVRYGWPFTATTGAVAVYFSPEFDKVYQNYHREWDDHDNKVFDYFLTVLILLDVLDNSRDQ